MQVAVVDTDQFRAEALRAVELVPIVHFDQRGQPEFGGERAERRASQPPVSIATISRIQSAPAARAS